MAKITGKNFNDLTDWNAKELRKLKIICKNRLSSISANPNGELKPSDLLYGKEQDEINQIIISIQRAEKALSNE